MFKFYFLAVLGVLFGVYMIYKDSVGFNNMTKIQGKILDKRTVGYSTTRRIGGGYHYSLAIKTNTVNYQIGIPLGDYFDKAYSDSISNLFDTGKFYTFYVNPLILSDNGLWDGVDKVEYNNKIIYQSRNIKDIIYGSLIILGTLIGIIYKRITYKDEKIVLLHPNITSK